MTLIDNTGLLLAVGVGRMFYVFLFGHRMLLLFPSLVLGLRLVRVLHYNISRRLVMA